VICWLLDKISLGGVYAVSYVAGVDRTNAARLSGVRVALVAAARASGRRVRAIDAMAESRDAFREIADTEKIVCVQCNECSKNGNYGRSASAYHKDGRRPRILTYRL
jgi:hypothetical protein